MLWADKRALETNLKLSLLQIRERELNFYTNNCLAISTQSALLAGFAYAALMPGISLGDAGGVAAHLYPVRLMYLTCAVSALGLQLITVVSTTLLSMLGPGLALRGPDGSMHTAVDGMVVEYRNAFYTFLFGMLATLAAGAFYCWLMFPAMEARPACSIVPRWQGPSSPPAPPRGAPAGSGWLDTLSGRAQTTGAQPPPRVREFHRLPGRSSHHPRLTFLQASILTAMILLITWCIVRYIRRLFETFAVPKELLVTGRYEANPDPDH